MSTHAKLAPSAAHRWFMCPGSVQKSAGIANESGVFAAEGTAAHSLASTCLEQKRPAAFYLGCVAGPTGVSGVGTVPIEQEADEQTWFEVTDEMVDAVQEYVDLCKQFMVAPWEPEIEQRLDLREVHKDVFGTGDFISYHPLTKALVVIDYKHGKGVPVEVKDNEQLLTYALGAALRFHNRGLSGIDLYVVQPRCPHPAGAIRHASYDAIDLAEFREKLESAALATEQADPPLVAGEWCRFCPSAPTCEAFRVAATDVAEAEFETPVAELTAEQTGRILTKARMLKDWIKRVEQHGQSEAQHGRLPFGFKLVAKRATRKWRNADDARAYLAGVLELDDEQIFEEPKMCSPAKIEAVIGKKRKSEIADLVEAISSGANLVPESDPRPTLKPDAEQEFA